LSDNGLTSIDVYRLKENFPGLVWLVIGNNNWNCSYLTKLTNDMTDLGINVWHTILDELGNDKSIVITDDSTRSIAAIGCNPKEFSNPRLNLNLHHSDQAFHSLYFFTDRLPQISKYVEIQCFSAVHSFTVA
jgi:hypothetical protein